MLVLCPYQMTTTRIMNNDYQNTKPQKIRFHVTAGAENIDLVNDLIEKFADAYGYEVTFNKNKQRGRTPLRDLHKELTEVIGDRQS